MQWFKNNEQRCTNGVNSCGLRFTEIGTKLQFDNGLYVFAGAVQKRKWSFGVDTGSGNVVIIPI